MVLRRLLFAFMLLAFVAAFVLPYKSLAHASLVETIPTPDSQLEHSPSQIVLHFSERLEKELYYIHLLDQTGKPATDCDATLSMNHRKLQLELPSLSDGKYTVTYKAISSDGHPVTGSYTLLIGEENGGFDDSPKPPLIEEHTYHEEMNIGDVPIYISNLLYTCSLLMVTGWIFWTNVYPPGSIKIQKNQYYWGLYLQACLLGTLIAMAYFHSQALIDEWKWDRLWALLLGTDIGLSWLVSVSLSIAGFSMLYRKKWLDSIWVLILYVSKSLSGHAAAFEPSMITVTLNIAHLFAAAIWAGGLLYIFAHWRISKDYVIDFLPKFSAAALFSIITLIVSGTCSTLIFLPKWSDLLETQWGILLIVKIMLVIFVLFIGLALRMFMSRKRKSKLKMMLKVDFTLMIFIIAIVGIFTYLNPVSVSP